MADTEICGNCGCTIGKLETPEIFGGSVVCAGCAEKLNAQKNRGRQRYQHILAPPENPNRFSMGRVFLLLAVIAGIIVIILLVKEWQARNAFLDAGQQFGSP
jgi:hypothetical protein